MSRRLLNQMKITTGKPVLRGHLWDKEIMAILDRWPLKRVSIHMKFYMTGSIKMWPFNTGDCFNRGDHMVKFDCICP